MTTAIITLPCEGIQAAIGSRQAPVIAQVACEKEWFVNLVTRYGKLYSASGSGGTGEGTTSDERKTYLKIASNGSTILLNGIE
jgi:hypothetical protein